MSGQRRSVLATRISRQPRAMGDHAAAHLRPLDVGAALPPAPEGPHQVMTMPLTLVQVTASGQQVSEALPMWAGPRGQTVPATAPGRWVQLYAAGRP